MNPIKPDFDRNVPETTVQLDFILLYQQYPALELPLLYLSWKRSVERQNLLIKLPQPIKTKHISPKAQLRRNRKLAKIRPRHGNAIKSSKTKGELITPVMVEKWDLDFVSRVLRPYRNWQLAPCNLRFPKQKRQPQWNGRNTGEPGSFPKMTRTSFSSASSFLFF